MITKYADFNTLNVESNLQHQFFQTKDRLVFLGAWSFGLKAPSGYMEDLPQFTYAKDDSDQMRLDIDKANLLINTGPRKCFDIFMAARNVNLFIIKEVQRLKGLGYTERALYDAINPKAMKSFAELELLGAQLLAEQKRCDDLENVIQTTFPKTDESEMQAVMFDLAIVSKIGTLSTVDKKQINEGMTPTRMDDARAIQAIYRTPTAVHGIDPETFTAIRKLYAAKLFPNTTHVLTQAREMVDEAANALTSAVLTIEPLAQVPTGALFAQMRGGDWLAEKRGLIAMSPDDFLKARMAKRFPGGMPHMTTGDLVQ